MHAHRLETGTVVETDVLGVLTRIRRYNKERWKQAGGPEKCLVNTINNLPMAWSMWENDKVMIERLIWEFRFLTTVG